MRTAASHPCLRSFPCFFCYHKTPQIYLGDGFAVPAAIFAHHSMVGPVKERLLVSKQATQKFDVKRFSLTKLSDFEGRKQYRIKI
jgi:hypothetical protein